MNQEGNDQMYESLERAQQVLQHFNNPKGSDVQEELEEYAPVQCNRLVYKLEEIEYEDVSPTKW
jgi:hypothetical protein